MRCSVLFVRTSTSPFVYYLCCSVVLWVLVKIYVYVIYGLNTVELRWVQSTLSFASFHFTSTPTTPTSTPSVQRSSIESRTFLIRLLFGYIRPRVSRVSYSHSSLDPVGVARAFSLQYYLPRRSPCADSFFHSAAIVSPCAWD
jgi:hypothetical protein